MIPLVGGAIVVTALLMTLLAVAGYFSRAGGTSDFTAATRPAPLLSSAAAAGGEYTSAATFLGFAGLLLAQGFQAVWMFVALSAGYVLLAAFVAAPLRRSGVYSPSDFAEWRLRNRRVRRMVSACVVFTGWVYLLAQYAAAGALVDRYVGLPAWAGWGGVAAVTLVIVLHASNGSDTGFQAVFFWVKLAAIGVPAVVLLVLWQVEDGRMVEHTGVPAFAEPTTVHVAEDQRLTLPEETVLTVAGRVNGRHLDGTAVRLAAGAHHFAAGSELTFREGAAVPHADGARPLEGEQWLEMEVDAPLLGAHSVQLALVLGVVGLPQFVARFYGAASPRAARRTVVVALVLVMVFSIFPLIYAGLGRLYASDLLATGDTDIVVLALPERVAPGALGLALATMVAVGAAAAVITVSAGLATALGGTISQCVLGGGTRMFRLGVLMAIGVPLAALLMLPGLADVSLVPLVLLAFRISAVTVAPVLLLGVWWRRLTDVGAAAGLLVGMAGVAAGVVVPLTGLDPATEPGRLLAMPTLLLAPLVFAVMVVVSRLSARRVPEDADAMLGRMHLPRRDL
ncbi:sodium:solute symporter family transporter [Marinitenerispora sediminis]|uniref:Cation acetate symporter n=1 Tax=Marinitenerispora sediminis TaxID=1931232 RepID=A0A368TC74_9ACTN|nr:cation acetate symporter [Marinitenerispora sediminis]RCV55281.1 cation acetate symporter [Marinitenerispora sediminis]RCV61614.1 cation acetate symporter [Marinitenerispora sediminis]RCV62655.1 cation acetate symporter [Marinitenerispora sediminis]